MRKVLCKNICAFIVAWILILVSLVYSNTSAVSIYDNAYYYDKNSAKQIWDNANICELSSSKITKERIVNFDVLSNRMIVIATNSNSIIVVDENGTITKTFTFSSYGSYYIKGKDDNLLLIFTRGETAIEFTTNCELVNVMKLDHSVVSEAWNDLNRNTIEAFGNVYRMTNNKKFSIVQSEFTTISKTDSEGNTIQLYNADLKAKRENQKWLLCFVILVLFIAIVYTIVKTIISVKHCKDAELESRT